MNRAAARAFSTIAVASMDHAPDSVITLRSSAYFGSFLRPPLPQVGRCGDAMKDVVRRLRTGSHVWAFHAGSNAHNVNRFALKHEVGSNLVGNDAACGADSTICGACSTDSLAGTTLSMHKDNAGCRVSNQLSDRIDVPRVQQCARHVAGTRGPQVRV